MLRTSKRIIPLVIVLFWLVMVGGLLYREVVLPYFYRGAVSVRVLKPQDIWLGLYFGEEQRVGFVHLRTTPEERGLEKGYALNVLARLEFPLFGQETRFQLSGFAWQSSEAGLRDFDFNFSADGHTMRIEGTAEEGVLKALLHTAGEARPFSLPVGREMLLMGGMGLGTAAMPALKPGEIAYVDTFDPTRMSVGRAKLEALRRESIEVAGETVETVVIATTVAGITTRAWVTDDEEVVRAETPFGLIIKKIAPEEAMTPLAEDDSANILRTLSVTPGGSEPNPDGMRHLYRVTAKSEGLLPPEDTRQWREADLFIVVRQELPDVALAQALSEEEAAAYLAPDLFIQSDHERIIAAAREITGDATTHWEKATLLYAWMYEQIEKEHVLSVPSALEVLDQRRGDCNEHAILFAALARAVGVPTRVVIGLAWSRKMQAFGYHAWNEVYAGDWIAMDPTFGEKIVGPTHIKLVTGSIDQWPQLLPYIGALAIEVLE